MSDYSYHGIARHFNRSFKTRREAEAWCRQKAADGFDASLLRYNRALRQSEVIDRWAALGVGEDDRLPGDTPVGMGDGSDFGDFE